MKIWKRWDIKLGLSPLILIAILAFAGSTRAGDVHWYASIEDASSAAQELNKPMMLDFSADWCDACKVMDKDVYADNDFAEAAKGFLTVRIDYDRKTAITRKYNVSVLPTVVFTDSYGDELFRYHGFIDTKPLVELMHSLPSDVASFNELSRILATDKNNFDALEAMGKNLRAAGLFLVSNDYYAKALQRSQAKADPSKREFIMEQIGLNSLEVKDGRQAAEEFEKCLKESPNSPNREEWTLNLSRAYAIAQQKDKARKVLENFMREHPNSEDSEKAKALLSSL
jgi:thioredoxin-like negative regulator of GroEL